MIAKAILTGGVLSVLAGSIVYFGTEGADATISDRVSVPAVDVAKDATDNDDVMAGGVETKLADAGPDKPEKRTTQVEQDKPKTKWLDQYLKRDKADTAKSEDASEDVEDTVETMMDVAGSERNSEAEETATFEMPNGKGSEDKAEGSRKGARDTAKGSYIVADKPREEKDERQDSHLERQIITKTLKDGERDAKVKVKVVRDKREDVAIAVKPGETNLESLQILNKPVMLRNSLDYDRLVEEADKLLVVDMRDSALLEIVDYAIDRGDMDQAKEILGGLSTPELRDTARARVGKGYAVRSLTDEAFGVLDMIEIDELVAPIRLEIIAALTQTRQERMGQLMPQN